MDKHPDPLDEVERRLGEVWHFRLDTAPPEVIAEYLQVIEALERWAGRGDHSPLTLA